MAACKGMGKLTSIFHTVKYYTVLKMNEIESSDEHE